MSTFSRKRCPRFLTSEPKTTQPTKSGDHPGDERAEGAEEGKRRRGGQPGKGRDGAEEDHLIGRAVGDQHGGEHGLAGLETCGGDKGDAKRQAAEGVELPRVRQGQKDDSADQRSRKHRGEHGVNHCFAVLSGCQKPGHGVTDAELCNEANHRACGNGGS